MADTNVRIVITTEDKSTANLNKIEGAVKTLAGAYIGIKGLQAAFGFLTDALKEAAEEEKSLNLLSTALKNSGQQAEGLTEKLSAYAEKMQLVTRFTDGELRNSMRQFVQFGMSAAESQTMLNYAMDLAVAKNMDLASATNMLGRAFHGNLMMLQRSGIEARTFDEALRSISSTMGGSAKAELTGYAKDVNELTKRWTELKEAMGRVAAPMASGFIKSILGDRERAAEIGRGMASFGADTDRGGVEGKEEIPVSFLDKKQLEAEIRQGEDLVSKFTKYKEEMRNSDYEYSVMIADKELALQERVAENKLKAEKEMWDGIVSIAGAAATMMTSVGVASNSAILKSMGVVLRGVETVIKGVEAMLTGGVVGFILGILGIVTGLANMKTQLDTLDQLSKENTSMLLQNPVTNTPISSREPLPITTTRPNSVTAAPAPTYNNYYSTYSLNAGVVLGEKSEILKAFDTLMQWWQREQALRVV